MTARPPTTAKSVFWRARLASSFSNSEGVWFGSFEGFMGKFLNEGFHLFRPPEPFARSGRAPNGFKDGLLHGFSFVIHGGKLSPDIDCGKTIFAGKSGRAADKSPRRSRRHTSTAATSSARFFCAPRTAVSARGSRSPE